MTFARLIGTGLFILMVFTAIKYSNSLRIYSYIKFITTLGLVIYNASYGLYCNFERDFCIPAWGYFYGLFCPLTLAYLMFFIEPVCGEKSLIEAQESAVKLSP